MGDTQSNPAVSTVELLVSCWLPIAIRVPSRLPKEWSGVLRALSFGGEEGKASTGPAAARPELRTEQSAMSQSQSFCLQLHSQPEPSLSGSAGRRRRAGPLWGPLVLSQRRVIGLANQTTKGQVPVKIVPGRVSRCASNASRFEERRVGGHRVP